MSTPPLKPLGFVVEGEARRALLESELAPDPARIAEGWERRFLAEDARAREMAALYAELGYEVCVDPFRPADLPGACESCGLLSVLALKTVYTRRRKQP